MNCHKHPPVLVTSGFLGFSGSRIYYSLSIGSNFLLSTCSKIKYLLFSEICGYKKGRTTNFPPILLLLHPGSEMDKNAQPYTLAGGEPLEASGGVWR
jgi:hypothetical protein